MPSVPNLRTNVLLHSEQTGGYMSVTEIMVPPHMADPPLHTHDFDEAFYMLEGELIFQVEDALVTKGAGELSFVPRNVAHALPNHTDARARYVLVCTPCWHRHGTSDLLVVFQSHFCQRISSEAISHNGYGIPDASDR